MKSHKNTLVLATIALIIGMVIAAAAPVAAEGPEAGSFVCGDVNGNGIVDYGDLRHLILFVFSGGKAPLSLKAADVNCDREVNVADIRYLYNYLFGGGPAPCANCVQGDPVDDIVRP